VLPSVPTTVHSPTVERSAHAMSPVIAGRHVTRIACEPYELTPSCNEVRANSRQRTQTHGYYTGVLVDQDCDALHAGHHGNRENNLGYASSSSSAIAHIPNNVNGLGTLEFYPDSERTVISSRWTRPEHNTFSTFIDDTSRQMCRLSVRQDVDHQWSNDSQSTFA